MKTIGEYNFETVDTFSYLGSNITTAHSFWRQTEPISVKNNARIVSP